MKRAPGGIRGAVVKDFRKSIGEDWTLLAGRKGMRAVGKQEWFFNVSSKTSMKSSRGRSKKQVPKAGLSSTYRVTREVGK